MDNDEQPEARWTAGTSPDWVYVDDHRYTNRVRRVKSDSTAAMRLPHTPPAQQDLSAAARAALGLEHDEDSNQH